MERNNSEVLPVIIAAFLFCLLNHAQTPPSITYITPAVPLQGKVVSEDGNPLVGVTVEVRPTSRGGEIVRMSTDNEGIFTLGNLPETGGILLKFSKEHCHTIARRYFEPADYRKKGALDFTMQCGEPPIPVKPHKMNPGVSYREYIGEYKMKSTFRGGKTCESNLTLTGEEKMDSSTCRCGEGWKVAKEYGEKGCVAHGCWRVEPDGDIKVVFPCGIAFAGSTYTIWLEGSGLEGYAGSWSDVGSGDTWTMTLTCMKKR